VRPAGGRRNAAVGDDDRKGDVLPANTEFGETVFERTNPRRIDLRYEGSEVVAEPGSAVRGSDAGRIDIGPEKVELTLIS